uniref:Uncharacterized protein n=1 Tax=Panagrolaimus superbus TaxID=310955 RepID=A0A914YFI4_9BILA
MVEMNTDLIHQSIHLVIAGRVLRLIVDEKFSNDNKKPSMNDLDAFFQDLFKAFTIKVHNKFGEISTMTHGVWPPWRKGTSPSMSDEISMGINHILNAIQKEAFCIFDIVYGRKDEIIDFLFYLYKQRRYFGFTFSKLDAIIRSTFSSYFENLEAAIDQKAQHQNHIRNNTCSENRPLNREYSQPQTVRQHRFEQQQQQTSYPSQSRNHQSSGYSGYTNGFETHPMQQNNTQRNNGNIRDGRPFNRSNDSGLQRSRGGNY